MVVKQNYNMKLEKLILDIKISRHCLFETVLSIGIYLSVLLQIELGIRRHSDKRAQMEDNSALLEMNFSRQTLANNKFIIWIKPLGK